MSMGVEQDQTVFKEVKYTTPHLFKIVILTRVL